MANYACQGLHVTGKREFSCCCYSLSAMGVKIKAGVLWVRRSRQVTGDSKQVKPTLSTLTD